MRIVAAAATDIGHVRELNEDSFLVHDPLFAIADGMGGHRGGEVASNLAVETLQKLFDHGAADLPALLQEANRAVFEKSLRDRRVAGMGTTLTAVLLEGGRLRLGHVGDSRAYLIRDGELRLLTEDHTLVHEMVARGEITEAEAEVHPHRAILTRALGVDMSVEVDEGELVVRPGDRILLCTDGLTGMIGEPRIREVLTASTDPEAAARALVGAAVDAGGVDNVTVVVLDLIEDGPTDNPHREGPTPSPDTGWHDGRSDSPAPERPKPPRPQGRALPWKRVAVWIAAAVAVVVVAVVGLRIYLDSQWYVGVSNGHVAIYRGIPASVAGFDLHRVIVESTVPADAAEELALYRDLAEGITAQDREEADAILAQIRQDVSTVPPNEPAP